MCPEKPIIFTIWLFSKKKKKCADSFLSVWEFWIICIRPADMNREKTPGKFTRNFHGPINHIYPFTNILLVRLGHLAIPH